MKRIIEIEEREFDLIEETTFVEDTDVMFRQTAEDREKTLMMFRIIDAIKQSKPYDDSGDLISREALKKAIKDNGYSHYFEIFDIIDNAQAIKHSLLPLSGEADNAYMRGYEVGKAEGILKANTRPKGEWVMFKDVQSVIKPILKRFYSAEDSDIEYIMQEIEQKAYLIGGEEG